MIKFFRKIRRNMLDEGKTGKYLKYAVGEILLVVIGILIALQINNWNENRKNRVIEKNILTSIKLDLISDTITYNNGMDRISFSNKSIKLILNKPELQDSLTALNFISSYSLAEIRSRTTSFEFLKSTGLDIVHHQELRDSIIDYYEEEVKVAIIKNDFNSKGLNINTLEPYLQEHFIFTTKDSSLTDLDYIPLNYKDLINDDKYSSLLIQRFIYNSQTLVSLQNLTAKAKNVINEIENKIDK
jgi:hypothetical protein